MSCSTCARPDAWCVCDKVVPLDVRTRVLILQHPQEIDVELGTAGLLGQSLATARVVAGLSWPNLSAALGDDTVIHREWAVLWSGSLPRALTDAERQRPIVRLDPRGEAVSEPPLVGIVALDGTWSQAKALWWRNPWLLKLQRLVLHPHEPSIYGRIRKEPRREAVSTLEAVALSLVANGEDKLVGEQLRRLMRSMVQRARDARPDMGRPRG